MALITIASSNKMEIIHPDEIYLIGGDTKTIELLVKYTGSGSATCKVTCEILPDGEGINITYIPDRFTVTSNSHQTMTMIINTSMSLQPGNYTMVTNVSYETTGESGGYSSRCSSYGGTIVIQAVDYAEDEDGKTPTDTDDVGEDLEYPYSQEQAGFDYIAMYFICGVIIFFIIVLLVYRKREKEKKRK